MNNNAVHSPKMKRSWGISPLWILPIVTMLLAGWLVMKSVNDAGERIQIQFSNGQGLVAGRTPIRYQGLEVGMVRDIKLSQDLDSIYVSADIYPEATKLLSHDTQFWLVKPKASLSGVSGLDALVSGNYIALQPGENRESDYPTKYHGLDNAPANLQANNGLTVTLKARDLGGISVGSQIVYKKIPIGEVYSYQLAKDDKAVLIQASIKDEYRHIITKQSRFWNVSGVGAEVGFHGVGVHLDSLNALISGAIAVDSPDGGDPVAKNTQFKLYKNLKTAGRGVPITIQLPDHSGITSTGSPIMFRGIEIGQITNLSLDSKRLHTIADAAIEPAFADMLTTNARFVLEEPQVSLSGVKNLGNFIKGNYLSFIPGDGERNRQFAAEAKSSIATSNTFTLSLHAADSYGIEVNTPVLYRGIPVGKVLHVQLIGDSQVRFDLQLDKKYQSLVKSQSRFYLSNSVNASLTENGVSVSLPSAKQLVAGSISFTSQGDNHPASSYELYSSQSLSELAQFNQSGSSKISLVADTLPSVQKGSPILYRNLQVGSVSNYTLTPKGVRIEANINNQYRHLINDHSVFWDHSGVKVTASLSGVSMQAGPLQSLLKGGIAFDTLNGVENKSGNDWTLYSSYEQAKRHGSLITLRSSENYGVKAGTPLEYQGVNIGSVTHVTPNFSGNEMTFMVQIKPEYSQYVARTGSRFWVAKANISLHGVDNVDKLLHPTINVAPGQGKETHQFELSSSAYQQNGVRFVLQSPMRHSLSPNTPVYFRQIEVGRVLDVKLGDLADRVVSTIEIKPQYAYLIRTNTVFWNTSGVNVSIGITGAKVKAGTLDSLVRGGVSFATPPANGALKPIAESGHAFRLHESAEDEWTQWQTPIPKP
ncbi:MCE family protein [Vibrio sp. CAIM 722]|uniref:MCE family protein n=1 Tax=Vibrio eleionomae TaxID=2653505 RepID=A0A7X4RTW8_9VIBR|nr:MlaD family protein [Vibrio eleionomae]MZI93276.1 MCE family protein [Vibrio eleionomae]